MLKPIQKTSLAASVFEQVQDLILSGGLAPGDPLPAERQLAEQLGVNRSAVREALKRLEQAGLISIQHGGNTRVLDFRRHAGLGILGPLLARHPGEHTDLQAFRGAILPEVCRAAAVSGSASQIGRLEMLVGLAASSDGTPGIDLISEYWDTMVDASHNVVFRLVWNVIERIPGADDPVSVEQLLDLTTAVAAGDTRGAALAARAMHA